MKMTYEATFLKFYYKRSVNFMTYYNPKQTPGGFSLSFTSCIAAVHVNYIAL